MDDELPLIIYTVLMSKSLINFGMILTNLDQFSKLYNLGDFEEKVLTNFKVI